METSFSEREVGRKRSGKGGGRMGGGDGWVRATWEQ